MFLPKLENNAWSTLAIESVLIVLSIVLGFLVTEWRQSSENAALAQTARESILSEVEENYRRVRRARQYHETMSDTLGSVEDIDTAAQIISDGFQGQSGVANPATVQSAAWEMAQSTGAVRHMSWDDVNALARVYTRQQLYDRQIDWFGRALFDTATDEGPQGLAESTPGFLPIINQFASQERQLLARYRQVLRRFGRSAPADTATVR
jgi:hypothetical protein